MSSRKTDEARGRDGDSRRDRSREDELYMMTGRTYVLCSVALPSTQWIETDSVAELDEWR